MSTGGSLSGVEAARARTAELHALLVQTRDACARVPGLTRPAATVGARGAWTGAAARALHGDRLAPLASRLSPALSRVVESVEQTLREAQGALRAAEQAEQAEQEQRERQERERREQQAGPGPGSGPLTRAGGGWS